MKREEEEEEEEEERETNDEHRKFALIAAWHREKKKNGLIESLLAIMEGEQRWIHLIQRWKNSVELDLGGLVDFLVVFQFPLFDGFFHRRGKTHFKRANSLGLRNRAAGLSALPVDVAMATAP